MDTPKKWWWVVGIAVPVVVALIAIVPGLLSSDGGQDETADIVYYKVEGNQYQGNVAYNSVNYIARQMEQSSGEALSENVLAMLRDAMSAVEDKDFDKGIPLLVALAETTSAPALLNNLGAAYMAAGEAERARVTLIAARDSEGNSPQQTAAVLHNLRQIATVSQGSTTGRKVSTEWPGVVAEITRLDTASGMFTLEAAYINTSAQKVRVCIYTYDMYLIFESSGEGSGRPSQYGGDLNCGDLNPAGIQITWAKFKIEGEVPATLTVVLDGATRPIEGVAVDRAKN